MRKITISSPNSAPNAKTCSATSTSTICAHSAISTSPYYLENKRTFSQLFNNPSPPTNNPPKMRSPSQKYKCRFSQPSGPCPKISRRNSYRKGNAQNVQKRQECLDLYANIAPINFANSIDYRRSIIVKLTILLWAGKK